MMTEVAVVVELGGGWVRGEEEVVITGIVFC